MASPSSTSLLLLFLLTISTTTSFPVHQRFLQCLSLYFPDITQLVHPQDSPSYSSILESSIQNLRFLNYSSSLKPLLVITPTNERQIQASVICSKLHNLRIRVLSGGHDYEGLSYHSDSPFVIINLINLRAIDIDVNDKTAWVQAGATIGELYYWIANKSRTLGFPAGFCPTIGVGGHFSGGAIGPLMRKYGLAADNIIDACLIDVNGRILNRETMGEDLFWAIRGGGAASFGVIVSWKVRLVPVPPTVTVFNKQGSLLQVNKWQLIADKLHEDLFIRVMIQSNAGKKEPRVIFNSLFLGGAKQLLPLMEKSFPELGLKAEDCKEVTWIESVLYLTGYPLNSKDLLLNRPQGRKSFYKAKSDFVQSPVSNYVLEEIGKRLSEVESAFLMLDPLGGRMSEISEYDTPFPHRQGNIYNIQYFVGWNQGGNEVAEKNIEWIRRLYSYMGPYVSNSPRGAYLNYRDLDLGRNEEGKTSFSTASLWGAKYFKDNFKRLAQVKIEVDPLNFFSNEQGIPPLYP